MVKRRISFDRPYCLYVIIIMIINIYGTRMDVKSMNEYPEHRLFVLES